MFRLIGCLCLFFYGTGLAFAQGNLMETPAHLTTCQLENHPNLYDKKLVEVTGRVYTGKFDFFIGGTCTPHKGARVWIDIGGDVESPIAYWAVFDTLPKHKGDDVRVRGISIPVSRDAMLDDFVNDVRAIRFRKPNGDGCGSECFFDQVTATVRGRFFSGMKGGFGMDACCSLLVIERVVSIASKRTSVPAGGEFQCTSERWQPTPDELKALSAIPACSLREDFRNCTAVLAKHWGDVINSRDSLDYPGPWMSPDMTRTYIFAGGFIQEPGKPAEMKPSSSVVRQVCRPLVAPKPASDHVYCRFFKSGRLENQNAAAALQKAADEGDDAWRVSDMAKVGWPAFEDASKQWSVGDDAHAKLSKCEAWPPLEYSGPASQQQYGYCTWDAPDGMQEITVELHKPDYLKPPGQLSKAIWVASSVETNVCRTESARP